MFKHIQAIRRQKPTNFLSMFDHFAGLALKGLNISHNKYFKTALIHSISRIKQTCKFQVFKAWLKVFAICQRESVM